MNNVGGTSARENLQDVHDYVKALCEAYVPTGYNPTLRVLDVGAGCGTYADALAGLPITLEAVEVWPETVEALKKDARYAWVYDADVRHVAGVFEGYHVVIFGDVLEHMSVHEAHVVWDRAARSGATIIVSVPNSHYPQGALYGNEHERHLIEDPVKELIMHLPIPTETWEYLVTNMYAWEGVL